MNGRPGRRLPTLVLLAAAVAQFGCATPAGNATIDAGAATGAVRDATPWPAIQVTGAESGLLGRGTIVEALTETGAFVAVTVSPGETDYQLSVNGIQPIHDSQGAVVGASIGSRLLWRGQYLDSFSYRLPVEAGSYVGKHQEGDTPARGLASTLASHLLHDFQARRAFSEETLHAALQSSDYRVLRLAEQIGVWRRQSLQVFHDPLLGAHARYRRTDWDAGHIDVFVYPIRSRDWRSPGPLLTAELESAGEDLVRLQGRGMLRELRLGPVVESPGAGASELTARQISGEFADPDYQPFDLHGYALIREDKFVKVLASIARHEAATTDVAGFVSVLAATIEVPPESRFMARVRRAWSGR